MLEALEGWWPYIVAMASGVIRITAAIHAAMTKEDPRAAIAWVGVILLSPFVGAGLYLVAGINRIRRVSIGNKRFRAESRHHRALHGAGASTGLIPPEARFQSMKKLGDRVAPFPLIGGTKSSLWWEAMRPIPRCWRPSARPGGISLFPVTSSTMTGWGGNSPTRSWRLGSVASRCAC